MATLWCPECRGEYREGFTKCADCGVALVAVLPPQPDTHHTRPRPSGPFSSEDVSVELINLSEIEAELVAAQLRSAGIPAAVVSVGFAASMVPVQFAQGSQVMVRRGDLAAARAVIADLPVTGPAPPTLDDAGLAEQAEAAAGWSDPESGAVV